MGLKGNLKLIKEILTEIKNNTYICDVNHDVRILDIIEVLVDNKLIEFSITKKGIEFLKKKLDK